MTELASRYFDDVKVGDELPALAVELTRTVIVATAIASRDYQDVHHDPDLAKARGSDDIFMNILSTNGFVGRFVTDWGGPAALIENVSIRLGAPNYPGDTMTLTGSVTEVFDTDGHTDGHNDGRNNGHNSGRDDGRGALTIAVRGSNSRGDHVTGTVRLALPRRGESLKVLP